MCNPRPAFGTALVTKFSSYPAVCKPLMKDGIIALFGFRHDLVTQHVRE